jgi:hypothetical protein
MRIPRVHFSVRQGMIGIAIFGLILGGILMEIGRRRDYQERLYYHYQQMEGYPPSPNKGFFFQFPQESQVQLIKSWVYHARKCEQYETALKIPFYFLPDEEPE